MHGIINYIHISKVLSQNSSLFSADFWNTVQAKIEKIKYFVRKHSLNGDQYKPIANLNKIEDQISKNNIYFDAREICICSKRSGIKVNYQITTKIRKK